MLFRIFGYSVYYVSDGLFPTSFHPTGTTQAPILEPSSNSTSHISPHSCDPRLVSCTRRGTWSFVERSCPCHSNSGHRPAGSWRSCSGAERERRTEYRWSERDEERGEAWCGVASMVSACRERGRHGPRKSESQRETERAGLHVQQSPTTPNDQREAELQ